MTKLNDLPDQGALLEDGKYTVVLDLNSEYTNQGSGEKGPYFNCDLVVNGGEFKGRHLYDIISYSPKSLWKVKQVLLACGMDGENDLPAITEGVDGAPVVDAEGLTAFLKDYMNSKELEVEVSTQLASEEDKKKGWKDKNRIQAYASPTEGVDGGGEGKNW